MGVRVNFKAKILDFNVPLLGSTSSELGSEGFSAKLSSFLYREPTSDECFKFNVQRRKWILDLRSDSGKKFRRAESHGFRSDKVTIIADNGC